MKNARFPLAVLMTLAMTACGGDAQDSDESGIASSSGGDTGEDGNDGNDSDDGDGDGDGDGNDSDDDGNDDGNDDDDDGGSGEEPKWDTLGVPDAPPCGGPGDGGDPEFSYIWVANSGQHTISKINTVTLIEEGRYMTRPDGVGSPSRTSVSLSGDVAVANRSGGVTKVFANPANCFEQNNQPGIQTAVDANYLQWNDEECRAWHTPMNYASQRPAAWAQGDWNNKTCGYDNEHLWTSGTNNSSATVDVVLLNGADGSIEDQVAVVGMQSSFYGMYGGAVDGDGNLWGSQLGGGKLVRVDRDDLSYQLWQTPAGGYGMTVDSEGYVWTCSSQVGRFDPETETWMSASTGGSSGGCMEDGTGILWQSGQPVRGVDIETLQVVKQANVPGYVKGISIDFEGHIWGVGYSTDAYKIDPDDLSYETFTGLTNPYTYSDMTGFALSNAGGAQG